MAADDRLKCLILGQQIGDNIADLGELLDDLVIAPKTDVATKTIDLAGAYVRRLDDEFKIAITECGLPANDPKVTAFMAVEQAWERHQYDVRGAWDKLHDLVDLNNLRPTHFTTGALPSIPSPPPPSGEVALSRQMMEDLLVTALEGGSNYWYFLPDLKMVPKGTEPGSIRIFNAVMNGARVPVTDVDEERTYGSEKAKPLGYITKEGLEQALGKMLSEGSKYKRAGARIIGEDYDAGDADAWFQTAVMNEVIYG